MSMLNGGQISQLLLRTANIVFMSSQETHSTIIAAFKASI